MNVPNHIAIIMDGNGRWAKAHGSPRSMGHSRGSKNVENICRLAWDKGVKYLTVYAFSTENWSRPHTEVDALMKLLRSYMKSSLKKAKENNMRVRVIGDYNYLDEDLVESIDKLIDATKDNTGLNFTIALNYGSRNEIIRSIKKLIDDCESEKLSSNDIDETLFSSYLDTKDLPDPDLLIRTSGELRLSNFLLWQLAYSEFYFAQVHWPDFDEGELDKALEYYYSRDRRYGKVGE